jgi:putative CocE/NonD family hydrolase
LAVDWFDHWLRGRPFRVVGPEAARLFRMGGGDGSRNAAGRLRHGGEWIAAETWPPRPIRAVKYYLHSGGRLEVAPPPMERPSEFAYDPDRPVPTIGGRHAGLGAWMPGCAQNQVCSPKILGCEDSLPLNRRPDVLSFQTAALASPVDVTGSVRTVLWISSDAPDTDFMAKLVDVYPDGYALIISDGQIRTRYRNSLEKLELMKPGRIYRVTVEVGSTSNRFAAGHRIRLDISSSNYPRIESNPNTGEPPNRWTRRVKARNTVYRDRRHPSYLELPQ